jgi:hypothetical protein
MTTLRIPRWEIVETQDEKPTLLDELRRNDADYHRLAAAIRRQAAGFDIERVVSRLVTNYDMTEREARSTVFRVPGVQDQYRQETFISGQMGPGAGD